MKEEFSIKEDIRIAVFETLGGLDVDLDEVYNSVEQDVLILDFISLSIYTAIAEQLSETGRNNEEVDYQIRLLQRNVIETLAQRNLL